MLNPGRYKKTDYSGLLGSFLASWILHCAMFAIAATTTIFYPQTADQEMISLDLTFASPASTPDAPLPQSVNPAAVEEIEEDDPDEAAEAADPDLEVFIISTLEPDRKKIPPPEAAPKPPARPIETRVSKPLPRPVNKPVPEKALPARPQEAAEPPAEKAPAPRPKPPQQPQQQKETVENEKVRYLQEEAAKEKALEENLAAERARTAELEKLAAEIARTTELEKQAAERARAAELEKQAAERARITEQEKLAAERTARLKLAAEKESIRRKQEAEQRAAHEQAQEKARAAKLAMAAELEKQEAENTARARLAAEKAKLEREEAENARREQSARLKREQEKAASDKLARERALAEKHAREKQEQARLAAAALNKQAALTARGAANPANAVAAPPAAVAATAEKDLPKKQTELKGLALPTVHGDIKLIMTGEADFIVKVLFVNHPKARHDRPISKKEAKDQQKLTPVVVRTGKNSLEAVLERSREGIYIFLVEQQGSKPVNGKFSIKLFESKNIPVAGRAISGQTEVARLLMPEGILWENDSAFSGTIEDSDSITKFNSESGLVWKEYRR